MLLGALPSIVAQETVTIPKARLEELERKERELDRLKTELSAAKGETVRLKQEKDAAVAKAAAVTAPGSAQPVVTHAAPAMSTLPPVGKGDTVDALDLVEHFRADPTTASARYRGKTFKVKGEIASFDKPMMTRNYHVLLRGPDLQPRVLCVVAPPEKYVSVFTARNGTQLMASLTGGARVPLMKIGDAVVIEGRCRGLDGALVEMGSCTITPAR
jgi:hypothetical protein